MEHYSSLLPGLQLQIWLWAVQIFLTHMHHPRPSTICTALLIGTSRQSSMTIKHYRQNKFSKLGQHKVLRTVVVWYNAANLSYGTMSSHIQSEMLRRLWRTKGLSDACSRQIWSSATASRDWWLQQSITEQQLSGMQYHHMGTNLSDLRQGQNGSSLIKR